MGGDRTATTAYTIVDDRTEKGTDVCGRCKAPLGETQKDLDVELCVSCLKQAKQEGTMLHMTSSSSAGGPQDYWIAEDGAIFCGLGSTNQVKCHLEDLPIWKAHPDPHSYEKFPWSALREQLALQRTLKMPKQSEASFDCFICSHSHDASS